MTLEEELAEQETVPVPQALREVPMTVFEIEFWKSVYVSAVSRTTGKNAALAADHAVVRLRRRSG